GGDPNEASSRLGAFLRGRKVLVIADDVFEPEHAAALKVLDRGTMLVSTRFPAVEGALDVGPEDVYRLEPLGEDDSVALLRRQAPLLAGQDPGQIAGLARELGGLPLFLKVAGRLLQEEAGYGRDAAGLLGDLRAGKEALLGERAPADVAGFDGARARTLEVLMRASLEGLNEGERAAFRALGTMASKPATFDMEAAEAVWDSDEGRALMRPLVRRGLVEADGKGRFSAHSVLGSFARFLLNEDSDGQGSYLRHVRHFVAVFARAGEAYYGDKEGLDRAVRHLDADWQNILRGWSWAKSRDAEDVEAARLCFGYLEAGKRWPSLRLASQEHEHFARAAVGCARRLGDGPAEAGSLRRLGHALLRADRREEAKDACQRARSKYVEIGDEFGEGRACGALGACHKALGDAEEAERLYLEQIRTASGEDQTREEAASEAAGRGNLGVLYRDAGRYEDAVREITAAAEIYDRIGDAREAVAARGNLGTVYHDQGDYDEAERRHLEFLRMARDLGDKDSECRAVGNLGNVYRARGEPEKSLEHYEENLVLARGLGHLLFEGIALAGIARSRALLGESEAATAMHRQALQTIRSTGTPKIEAMILTDLAQLLRLQGEPHEALEHAAAAQSIYEGLDFPPGEADAFFEAGLARYETGRRAAAVRDAERAREIYASLESPREREVEEQLRSWREEEHAEIR
ncbi:MAG TPA: tetratricopeptide repeat protein, partial [Rubrobacter sp.]|nr:tetratricopeptide repeat protein [Rubrobacter sp.]